MNEPEELNALLSSGARVIVIAERDVDLRPGAADNRMFLLRIGEGSLAAGGRGGGFGERRVVSVSLFVLKSGEWTKGFGADEDHRAAEFEVPYHVSRLPLILKDGSEAMGYGVVDPDLVREFSAKASAASSA